MWSKFAAIAVGAYWGLRGRTLAELKKVRLRTLFARIGAVAIVATVAACSNFSFGPGISTRNTGNALQTTDQQALPAAAGQPIGNGPVRVALLLPVTGEVANVGISMANGARLAMEFIQSNTNIAENITLVLKDTRGDPAVATRMASEAVREGASLILGPLRAESVRAASTVTRSAGIPMIGFSNNSGAASPGAYLLNVLPEGEVRRSLSYAKSKGRGAFVAIVPNTPFGAIQDGAFRQAVADLGLNARAVYTFSNESEARVAVEQIIPLIQAGQVDAVFMPDRSTAPSFGVLFESANLDRNAVTLIGSADWSNDPNIAQTSFLVGAIYPAIDEAGMRALLPQYQARFGAGVPHPFTTIAYTATLVANASGLAMGTPKYDRARLTDRNGFNGRDGLFRFLPDGRSEYALTIKEVAVGGARVIDGARLP